MTAPEDPRVIVLVEDSDWAAAALEIALADLERAVLVRYRRAEDALSRISLDEDGPSCALITDLHLPGMDGFELIRRVRRLRPAGTLPIIVVSGDSDPESSRRATALGADAYYRKPYSPSEVRATLEKLLNEYDDPTLTA